MDLRLGVPPTLLLYGSRDHIVEARFGRVLNDRLRAAGATSFLLELPWSEHAFDAVPNGLGGQVSLYYVERFLAEIFRRSPFRVERRLQPPRTRAR